MTTDAVDRANAIQRAQAGVIHARQARAAGMSERRIAGRLESRAWVERHRDVYACAGAPETFDARCFAALLAVRHSGRTPQPRRVAVSGLCAAYAHDLDVAEPRTVELVVPGEDWAPDLPGVRVTRATTWPRRVFTVSSGLVVTGVADTVVDVAFRLPGDEVLRIVQNAAFGRPGLPYAILGACRRGRTGSAAARRAAALVLAGVDSSLHRRGHGLARLAGLPPPSCATEVVPGAGPSDCVFRVRGADAPPFGLVVEWDGDAHRVDRRTFLHDREKDRLVRRAGYVTIRYSSEQVRRAEVVVADLRAEWAGILARSLKVGRRARAS